VATPDTATWVGNRIRQTRERLGLSQGELARRLHKTQTAVSYWESGKRSPGLDALLDLARIFDKDVAYFLPRAETRQSLQAALRATAERLELHGLDDDLERIVDAARGTGPPQPELEIASDRPVEAAQELLAKAAVAGPPVDVEALARRCGVATIRAPFDAAVAGALIALGGGAVIAINEPPRPGGRRFDIEHRTTQRFFVGHQLGHHVLGHCDRVYLHFSSTAEHGDPPGYDWRHERDANDFAAELLMPAAFVKVAAREEEFVEPLAERFGVSPLAMAYRLISLGLR
jgi:transcriptional regulator with XRE-family HTH domain